MENKLDSVWFWAKVSGMCRSIVGGIGADGKVWLSEDERAMLERLGEISPSDAVNLCSGWRAER